MLRTLLTTLSLAALLACGGGSNGAPLPPTSTPPPVTEGPEVAWLKQAAKPFATVDPKANDADLAILDGMVGDQRVVALGEATHGTSEFFKMKHRLLRYLVEHKGFRAFGIEAAMGRCTELDRYVLTGEGDPAKLVPGMGFWTWSTTEVLDLVTWMRAYNMDPAHTEKLRFFGFDMQDGLREMDKVLAYVQSVDASSEPSLRALYLPFRSYTGFGNGALLDYSAASVSARQQCHDGVAQVYQWLSDHRQACVAATSAEAYEWALRMAFSVVQTEGMLAVVGADNNWGQYNARDRAMADNAEWFVQTILPTGKAVLWAHNGHINRLGSYAAWKSMGQWLSERLGNAYLTVGFGFNQGSATAIPMVNGIYGSLQSNTIPPAEAGSIESVFVAAGFERAILDQRNLNTAEAGAAWWMNGHAFREFGAIWDPSPRFGVLTTWLPARFHIFVFIKDTTASQYYFSPALVLTEQGLQPRRLDLPMP